jgi:hypothetical protein
LLRVGSSSAAFLKSFSGFDYESEVAKHDLAADNFQVKQASTYKYSPAKAKIGMNQAGEMAEWIRASFKKKYMTKSGEFVAANFDYEETHRITFQDALMQEIALPKLEGNSKEPGYMDITFLAEDVQHLKGKGDKIQGEFNTNAKECQPHMFRVEVAGLEDACKRVASVDPITFKQATVRDEIGIHRIHALVPAKVELGNIKMTLSAADAPAWAEWADAWFRQGKCLTSDHKDGAIYFMDPTGKDIGHVELKQLGLAKFSAGEHTANSEAVKRVTVELYVQEIEMMFNQQYVK